MHNNAAMQHKKEKRSWLDVLGEGERFEGDSYGTGNNSLVASVAWWNRFGVWDMTHHDSWGWRHLGKNGLRRDLAQDVFSNNLFPGYFVVTILQFHDQLHNHQAMYPGQLGLLGMLRASAEGSHLPSLEVQSDRGAVTDITAKQLHNRQYVSISCISQHHTPQNLITSPGWYPLCLLMCHSFS